MSAVLRPTVELNDELKRALRGVWFRHPYSGAHERDAKVTREKALQELAQRGLVQEGPDGYIVTEEGRLVIGSVPE